METSLHLQLYQYEPIGHFGLEAVYAGIGKRTA